MEAIFIDIGFVNLVAEKYRGVDGAFELVVYFQDKATGCITQDIVTVRQESHDNQLADDAAECLVWADCNDENYTHKFTIHKYVEGDDGNAG